jgi:hypothetical protein
VVLTDFGASPLTQILVLGWAWVIPIALSIAGALAKNKQKNRETENVQAAGNAQLGTQQYSVQQQALLNALLGESNEQVRHADIDLERKKFALDALGTRGKQALLGSLLQNLQPAEMKGLDPRIAAKMPKITGGLSPSALGPMARQFGALMQQQALSNQQKGDQFDPLQKTNFRAGVLPSPGMPNYKGPGKLESILGLLGAAGGAYGAATGGQGYQFNNSMPSPYTGADMYGNATDWQLPKGYLS